MKKIWLLIKNNYLYLVLIFIIFIASLFLLQTFNQKGRSGQSQADNKSNQSDGESVEAVTNDLGDYYISIPKLNISAPIIRGVDPTDESKYDKALEDGVAQMTGTPLPGTGGGNTFIYGHSSADDDGLYSQVFAGLDNLKFGDTINLNFEGQNYQYWVFDKKFVEKTDLSVLDQSGEERLTLMTCWPIGTDDRRLIVVAKRK